MAARTLDVSGAAQRFRTMLVDGYAAGRNRPGFCARWTYFAVMPGVQNTVPIRTAMDVWNYAPAEHRHPIPASGRVPSGGVICLGVAPHRTDANAKAGDVYVSDGGAGASGPATDYPSSGRIGTTTAAARARQTGRPVLGWVSWFGGFPLSVAPSAAPATPAAPAAPLHLPNKETDMPRIVRIEEPSNKALHGGVLALFPDRILPFNSVDAVYRFGRAWGLIPPVTPDKVLSYAENINAAEYQVAVDEIRRNRAALVAEAGAAVWDTLVDAPENGKQPAKARLSGADMGRNVSDAMVAKIAAKVVATLPAASGGSAPVIDVDALKRDIVSDILDGLHKRLES